MNTSKLKATVSSILLILLVTLLIFRGPIWVYIFNPPRVPIMQGLVLFSSLTAAMVLSHFVRIVYVYRKRLMSFQDMRRSLPVVSTTLNEEQTAFIVDSLENKLPKPPKLLMGLIPLPSMSRPSVIDELMNSIQSHNLSNEQLNTLNSVLLCHSDNNSPISKWWECHWLDKWCSRIVRCERLDTLSDADKKCTMKTIERFASIEAYPFNKGRAACSVLPDSGHTFSVMHNKEGSTLVIHNNQGRVLSCIKMQGSEKFKKDNINSHVLVEQKGHLLLILKLTTT